MERVFKAGEAPPETIVALIARAAEVYGDRARVRIDSDVPIVAEITPAALADLKLAEGGDVWLSFKATDVSVYPA